MRILLPAKTFSTSLFVAVFCVPVGFVLWNNWHIESFDKNLAILTILITVFLGAIAICIKETIYGPIFQLYGETKVYQIPLEPKQDVMIGPINNVSNDFLLIDMVLNQSLERLTGMRSFRISKGVGDASITGRIDLYTNNSKSESALIKQLNVSWSLNAESYRFDARPTHSVVIPVVDNYDEVYLRFCSFELAFPRPITESTLSQETSAIRVRLAIGLRAKALFNTGYPSMKDAQAS